MSVLVDTSVWSLALRRRASNLSRAQRQVVQHLQDLIDDGDAAIVGPVRQELLSGIRHKQQFDSLRKHLLHFPHIAVEEIDYDLAAECFNACRSAGVAATGTDMLLCAIAMRAKVPLFTIDRDFLRYAKELDVRLVEV